MEMNLMEIPYAIIVKQDIKSIQIYFVKNIFLLLIMATVAVQQTAQT